MSMILMSGKDNILCLDTGLRRYDTLIPDQVGNDTNCEVLF